MAVFLPYWLRVVETPKKPYSGSCTNRAKQWAKWKINLEMTPYILEAEQILLQYNDNDYNALAEQLKNKNNGLIKSCTMDGKKP